MFTNKDLLTADEVRQMTAAKAAGLGWSQLAVKLECSRQSIHLFMSGQAGAPRPVLDWLGLDREIAYRRIKRR